ncbi:SDR family NAD(P)-dependent oxidoreductase [Oceanobacillus sp. M60]
MTSRFDGKVAIVTGAASGIGEATAVKFAEQGAKVVLSDMSEKGRQLSDELNHKGLKTTFIQTDVTNEVDIQKLIQETVAAYDRLDIVFANAGIGNSTILHELSLKDWQKVIDVNLTGVFLTNKYAIKQMLKQEKGGAIVNNDSIHGFVGKAGVSAYAAAKGGVKLLTQTATAEYAAKGIRINNVNPGYIDTPLLKDAPDEAKQDLIRLHPIGRLGKPEEVANAVLFLASEEASFITGASLLVDGGYTSV